MSKVSRKSELSPSITRGGNGIDLGKNSGVDLGRKSEPSITSGGIGVTQDITSIGGATVSGGIEIDITPVDFGVNVDGNGTVSVSGGAEVPGGLLGVSGGIEIDLNTGEVTGGSIGAEVGGIGINLSNSKKGGRRIEFTLQIPGTPIELSLGLGFPAEEEEPTPTPTPTPTPLPTGNNPNGISTFKRCKGGSWELIGNAFSGTDIRNRFYKLEEALARRDAYEENRTDFNEFAKADNEFGVDKWYRVIKDVKQSTPGGQWIYISDSNTSFFGSLGTVTRYNAPCERTWQYYQYLPLPSSPRQFYAFSGSGFKYKSIILSSAPAPNCPNGDILSPPPPFPNPPPRKQKKMDTCCRENLAFLRLIYTKLGLARLPGQLPNTIIQEVPKEGEEPAEPPQVPIPDLVSLMNWTFERDDERWGQWTVQINVKDSDVTKEGDQGKQVKFPNLAESIAEIEGQILSLTANVDALVAITTKNLVESGLGRQEAIKSYLAAKSIIKYMAFKTTEIDVDIPACFTPEAQTIHELVNESTIHFKGIDYTEKETLRDIYLDLLQAAAIIRAVHWQRIDTKQNTKGQILAQLRGIAGLASSVKNPTPAGETQPKHTEDFEDFIDTVEDGFRNVTGVADPENPYGKTPDRRPKIRQIGNNISQAGGKS